MTEKEFNIIGKDLDKGAFELSKKSLNEWREEGMEKIDGEIEKSPEETRWILMVNEYIDKEVEKLGLEQKNTLLKEQVHMLSEKSFNKNVKSRDADGAFRSMEQGIYIEKENRNRIQILKTVLHEALHFKSLQKFYVDSNRMKIDVIKLGYQTYKPDENDHEHFRG